MTQQRKNIQVIDGALNCAYAIYSVTDTDFCLLFPEPKQDIEFADEFFARLGARAQEIWDRIWQAPQDKKIVCGIHGTLFCGLDEKKRFYPTRRESEMVAGLD